MPLIMIISSKYWIITRILIQWSNNYIYISVVYLQVIMSWPKMTLLQFRQLMFFTRFPVKQTLQTVPPFLSLPSKHQRALE